MNLAPILKSEPVHMWDTYPPSILLILCVCLVALAVYVVSTIIKERAR